MGKDPDRGAGPTSATELDARTQLPFSSLSRIFYLPGAFAAPQPTPPVTGCARIRFTHLILKVLGG